MTITTTEQIILIVLAVALALFLILSIIVVALVLRLMKSVNRITTKAEQLMDSAEAVGEVFRNVSGPAAVLRVVSNIVQAVSKEQGKKRS